MTDTPLVFIDTSFFKAIIDQKDEFHNKAAEISDFLKKDKSELVTSNFILDESFTLIRIKCGLKVALKFREYLEESGIVLKIIRVTVDDEAAAWDWFVKDWSKLSFTDCTSFALMKRLGIEKAAAFDDHFKRAGFKLVL